MHYCVCVCVCVWKCSTDMTYFAPVSTTCTLVLNYGNSSTILPGANNTRYISQILINLILLLNLTSYC